MSLQQQLHFITALCILNVVEAAETSFPQRQQQREEPAYSVFFPSFTLTLGVVVFFFLSRYLKALPYTAFMFLLGTIMGIVAVATDDDNHITKSIRLWQDIDSEVLLLVFLPGLLYRDAMSQNVHLFVYSLSQLLIFAFPMVLAGTYLTALIGTHLFPYGWSFNFAMAFGSILSATDPVAVAALLEEVGAPPRLKTHVAGESLLNDGAAIVFYVIFQSKYFFEEFSDSEQSQSNRSLSSLEIEDIDVGQGFSLFFRMSLGGLAIGLAFGMAQVLLLLLFERRASREENIVEVTSILALAYLNFYVAEFVCQTSGVISTVSAGLFVKFFGRAAINDIALLTDFTVIVEHILNTILFTLGGIIWGEVVAKGITNGLWTAADWGYLVMLYFLLLVIRACLFTLAFPITSRIGLKTNWKESLFQIYGGLRGALGIALAISLDNGYRRLSLDRRGTLDCEVGGIEEMCNTTEAFTMIGGIAFMTLVINGISAGPLLKKLGLASSTEARHKITSAFAIRLREETIEDLVRLLAQPRFHQANFALIKYHVPCLRNLTRVQLMDAVKKYRDCSGLDYVPPYLRNILPYLPRTNMENQTGEDHDSMSDSSILEEFDNFHVQMRKARRQKYRKNNRGRRHSSNIREMMKEEPLSTRELRMLFVSLLRAQYQKQMTHGELEDEHLLSVALDESLNFASDSIERGKPLEDWRWLKNYHSPLSKFQKKLRYIKAYVTERGKVNEVVFNWHDDAIIIERSMAFLSAHEAARAIFEDESVDFTNELSEGGKIVLHESILQCALAESNIKNIDPKIIELATSHKLCKILLHQSMSHIEKLVRTGLLKESEAEHFLEELQEDHDHVLSCDLKEHPDEVPNQLSEVLEETVDSLVSNNLHDQADVEGVVRDDELMELSRISLKMRASIKLEY